ncbi:MAG: hypothetical protein ABI615_13080 [Chthoniobacterales bacterium]
MKQFLLYSLFLSGFVASGALAQSPTPQSTAAASAPAPTDNRYDVLGKMLAPFVNILLTDTKSPNHAALLSIEFVEVSGRLPKQFKGAHLSAAIQYPDKVKLEAPILGEQSTVCRNGDQVWAIPGAKIQYLLKQFKIGPEPMRKSSTPLALPITAQQAVFLPALFTIEDGGFEDLNGEQCRIIQGGLMPEIAKAAKADDFRAKIWIAAGYLPRQIEIHRKDFSVLVAIKDLRFGPALTKETWEVPPGNTDVYRCSADNLERVLYVVMNSLKMKQSDAPWATAK